MESKTSDEITSRWDLHDLADDAAPGGWQYLDSDYAPDADFAVVKRLLHDSDNVEAAVIAETVVRWPGHLTRYVLWRVVRWDTPTGVLYDVSAETEDVRVKRHAWLYASHADAFDAFARGARGLLAHVEETADRSSRAGLSAVR